MNIEDVVTVVRFSLFASGVLLVVAGAYFLFGGAAAAVALGLGLITSVVAR